MDPVVNVGGATAIQMNINYPEIMLDIKAYCRKEAELSLVPVKDHILVDLDSVQKARSVNS